MAVVIDEGEVAFKTLKMDPRNPRAGTTTFASEDDAIASLIETADVDEIVTSIQSAGWIDFEPLIVERGSNIVLEGNRRLAALKLLTDDSLRRRLEYRLPVADKPVAVPTQIRVRWVADRREARNFIAFKHINGPAKWDAFAKARYASEWLDEGADVTAVSRAVGDNHSTVLRLVNGLAVLNQAEQSGFDKSDITARQFNFSHLYTAITRPSVRKYLELPVEVSERLPKAPVPQGAIQNLQTLMGWLFGQARQGREHVVKSQNPDLGRLVRVIAEPRAMVVLEREKSLKLAFDEVEPPSMRFEDALKDTAVSAEKTLGLISHFESETQASLIETVEKLASSVRLIRNEMRAKLQPEDDL